MHKRRIGCLMRQAQVMLLILVAGSVALALFLQVGQEQLGSAAATALARAWGELGRAPRLALTPLPTRVPPRGARGTASQPARVGIIAGHYGPTGDPGAVCPDGLREVDVNLAVAERVVAALCTRGYQAELLEEYDDRLKGYAADALLSIHSDACDVPEASGFKVARVSDSAIPEIEDALVECLYEEYGRLTGLPRHDYSITPDMHGYHAFVEIDPQTPGAIIEIGFLGADRSILVQHPERVAEGIFAGLVCFLER